MSKSVERRLALQKPKPPATKRTYPNVTQRVLGIRIAALEARIRILEARPQVGTTVICPCPCHSGHNIPTLPPWTVTYGASRTTSGG